MNVLSSIRFRILGLLRRVYRRSLAVQNRIALLTAGGGSEPRVFYGGAPAGSVEGPRLKIQKLRQSFPEHRWDFNVVYMISAGTHLSDDVLRRLKARRIPIVMNQNGVFYPGWYAGDWEAENRRMAVPYCAADHVFYQSEFCKRSAEHFLGSRENPSEILYNAVDTAHFKPAARAGTANEPFVLMVAGKIPPHQSYRLESAIDGFAAAHKKGLDVRLVVAGAIAPQVQSKAMSMCESHGITDRVAFQGIYRQEDAPDLLNGADAFVLTTHNDACPSGVIEAMACGLPVVYVKSGGVPELVGDDAGVGIETGESWEESLVPDKEALGDAMIRVAEDRAAFAVAARARAVERFDIKPWYERHRAVFETLLAARCG